MSEEKQVLLKAKNIRKWFPIKKWYFLNYGLHFCKIFRLNDLLLLLWFYIF